VGGGWGGGGWGVGGCVWCGGWGFGVVVWFGQGRANEQKREVRKKGDLHEARQRLVGEKNTKAE